MDPALLLVVLLPMAGITAAGHVRRRRRLLEVLERSSRALDAEFELPTGLGKATPLVAFVDGRRVVTWDDTTELRIHVDVATPPTPYTHWLGDGFVGGESLNEPRFDSVVHVQGPDAVVRGVFNDDARDAMICAASYRPSLISRGEVRLFSVVGAGELRAAIDHGVAIARALERDPEDERLFVVATTDRHTGIRAHALRALRETEPERAREAARVLLGDRCPMDSLRRSQDLVLAAAIHLTDGCTPDALVALREAGRRTRDERLRRAMDRERAAIVSSMSGAGGRLSLTDAAGGGALSEVGQGGGLSVT